MFSAKFETELIGAPPAETQVVGTTALDIGAGTIEVVPSPSPAHSDQWLQISHPTAPSNQTALRCNLASLQVDGSYSLIAVLYIPTGAGVATVQFEPFNDGDATSYLSFLHLDFMPDGTVRVDDSSTTFGNFPRDQSFVLTAKLNITAASATAHFALLGGASGELDVNVNPAWLAFARGFGAVRFWMGFQHTGSFFVNDILVFRKNS